MRKTFKYRIYPNKTQIQQIDIILRVCRDLYNLALAQRIMVYLNYHKNMSRYDQINQLPELKKEFPEFSIVHGQTLQEVLARLDKAYQNFFRRIKQGKEKPGFPRFKSTDRYNSFTFPQYDKLVLHKDRIPIPKLGDVKIIYSRAIEGTPKILTIRKEEDQYYACISCETDLAIPKVTVKNFVGIDLGLTHLIMCSDGTSVNNPRHLKNLELKLKKHQRRMSKKTKGSNNRRTQRKILYRIHRKIKNQRHDFLHKLSRRLINKYDLLVFEDLRILNMLKNHRLAKAIADASWNTLLQYCTYKAEEAGKTVIQVDPRMTTKMCSRCGDIQQIPLWQRGYSCPTCGISINRDMNAARNILSKHLHTAGYAGIYASGDTFFNRVSLKEESSGKCEANIKL
jgi:putative transposase